LIGDLVRETRIYESILRSIANVAHTPADMVQPGQNTSNLSPYLKRLIELKLIEQGQVDALWKRVSSQARLGKLAFSPDIVGSHWAVDAQVNVVAVNWQEKTILLGECMWGTEAVGRSVVRELVEKQATAAPGSEWQAYYALFSQAGFTEPALKENETAIYVDLAALDAALSRGASTGWPTDDLPI